ncbi:hypothetical protein [Nocardia sp. CS682]|uniref:hypothetical protein n=1 Tax=Nocardia sp. CS682 TaxID=1047172 RepID=UPI001430A08E|nr:hypothetical protein [Nocardia sp. CS682]
MTGRRLPNPVRGEPVFPAGVALLLYAISTVVAGVFGGGAVSAVLAGHGVGFVAPAQMVPTLIKLAGHPSSPAAAWPDAPRPGPAWLTWLCIGVVATVWCSLAIVVSDVIDSRWRHRHQPGLATTTDLRRIGLDHRSAVRHARYEFPSLVRNSRRWWRWGR